MSSARVDSDGRSLINEENIEKEAKYYKNLKSKNSWKSFEEYSDYISRFWQIQLRSSAFDSSNCRT
jgi:hypothetical protein